MAHLMVPDSSACSSLQVYNSVLITEMNGYAYGRKDVCKNNNLVENTQVKNRKGFRDSPVHLPNNSTMPSLIGSLTAEYPVSVWTPSGMDISLPHEATISFFNSWQMLPSILSPSRNSTSFLWETAAASFPVASDRTCSGVLLPGLFALISIPCLSPCPSLDCRGECADRHRPSVSGSHFSWVLMGLTNGRPWLESGGWGDGSLKVC